MARGLRGRRPRCSLTLRIVHSLGADVSLRRITVILLGTASVLASQAAFGADLNAGVIVDEDATLPAVSGVNGKFEFSPGLLSGVPMFRAAGSLSVPVGDKFGIQADVMGTFTGADTYLGGALHAFTRDPSSYLAGITAGVVVAPGQSTLMALGAEGELYLDRVSLEGWAGVAALNYVDPMMVDLTGAFAFGDLAYYATDDFRVSIGGTYLLGDLSLHAATEYQFTDLGMPLSLTGDARLHANGDYSLTVGLKGYFGGDNGKSLIDRHRQDDPPNRALSLFTAGAGLMAETSGTCSPYFDYGSHIATDCFPSDPEAFCISEGYDDFYSPNGECYNYPT